MIRGDKQKNQFAFLVIHKYITILLMTFALKDM